MALIDVLNELDNRSTFGTSLVLNDGNLRIAEGVAPERVAIMGACSASESNSRGTDYLIPTGVPFRLATLQDLKYFQNDDPDQTPSEILTAFEDVYNAGARSFEMVIVTRTVGQLGADVSAAATVLPVSTIYTNKMTPVGTMGAHPLGNTNFAAFEQNGDYFAAGGERPDTPAAGDITTPAKANLAAGDYFTFTHTDGTVIGFWFNVSGADSEPAALTSAVAAGTAGSVAIEIDVSGGTTAEDMRDYIAAGIQGATALPITAFRHDSNTDEVVLESDEAGTAGNSWTLAEVVTDAGFTVTTLSGGGSTNTISRRIMFYDPATGDWDNAVDAEGVAMRLVVGTRDAGAVRESATQVNITGGMTTIKGGADTAVATVDDITFAGAASSVVSSVGVGIAIGAGGGPLTTLGEAAWVQAGSQWYIIGGQTGSGTRIDDVATFDPVTGTNASVDTMAADKRWVGAYYNATHDRIYIFGGETASGAVATTEIFDVSGGAMVTSVSAGNLSEAKYDMGYAGLNDAGWSFGGVNAAGDSDRIERFDPETLTWQRKSDMDETDSGGRAVAMADLRIAYADGEQGYYFNVGLGNLGDTYVDFPDTFPFYIQVDWEIMSVTGVTTTRGRGRDLDAFLVTRAQKGSTAVAHSDYSDVVEDPEALFDDMDAAYEKMIDSSRADYILPPARAVADNPYLPAGENFAYQAATYCYLKGVQDRACMAVLPVFPPIEEIDETPTDSEKTTWVNHMINFTRTNHNSEKIWEIGDGVTDSDGDKKPDTYAFYATTDGEIPTGSPPSSSAKIIEDNNDVAVDIGKYLHIVYPYGFSTGPAYRKKWPNSTGGILRSGYASFMGTLSTLQPSVGSTNQIVSSFEPWTLLSFVKENQLNRRRYMGAIDPGDGSLRWNTGYTFAWNVDEFNRSDYVLGSTFRKSVALSRLLRSVLVRYYGKPVNGPHINALQVDISETITAAVAQDICGPATDFEFRVSRADKIIGRGTLSVQAEFEGELTHVELSISQFVR